MIEAAYRMIQNNLDAEVAEHPEQLVVYGGIGRAARDWQSYDKILEVLRRLQPDETLLIQSGKPCRRFQDTCRRAARAAGQFQPGAALGRREHFHELDRKGLMMYRPDDGGSWIYIGSQGIVQGTYETFYAVANRHFGGDPNGRWILTAGLGGMGGAQPLAATMAGFSMIAVECDESRIDFRLRTRYIDVKAKSLDEALGLLEDARKKAVRYRSACREMPPTYWPTWSSAASPPDCVTDQTSAHDPLNGYLPQGWTMDDWKRAARRNRTPWCAPPSNPWPGTYAPC